ncbi:hypothetical protein [Actinomadura hibisca]|uniref:hypothetical protein n=1 Tax=Actinomadura hibisca TaxID=68565 RepID=UPI00082B8588|nr:hypothetical protein [Actinomadura hibisca]
MPQFIKPRTERDYLEGLSEALSPWRESLTKMLLTVNGKSELEIINRFVPEITRTVRVKIIDRPPGPPAIIVWTDACGEVPGETVAEKAQALARDLQAHRTSRPRWHLLGRKSRSVP